MTTTTDLDFEIFLCPRWCAEKRRPDGHSDDNVEGSGPTSGTSA